ncbi:MAG: MoaD/ThiS family protein [Anaerolineales bacterium]|nr:MoaD/ThiS family protein [Anaerolineales bacterium]
MSVILKFRKEEFTVASGLTVRKALEEINIPPDSVLPTRNGELITEDEILHEGDVIRLVAVISGG